MDVEDFPTSPAKRQRTGSPEESRSITRSQLPEPASVSTADPLPDETMSHRQESAEIQAPDSNNLLDALMLQVEAQSGPFSKPQPASIDPTASPGKMVPTFPAASNTEEEGNSERGEPNDTNTNDVDTLRTKAVVEEPDRMDVSGPLENGDMINQSVNQDDVTTTHEDTNIVMPSVGNSADTPILVDGPSLAIDAIPPDQTIGPDQGPEGAEWEIDSSPYESSSESSSDSSDDSSSNEEDSDEDVDGDYSMLDPEETARILMQGDGGSDDEGGRSRDKADGAPLRTANERQEEVIPKPDIVVTAEMKIEELGHVEFVVESTVVIKAKTSGEYQVLEPGSLICLKERSVVGVVADLIGRVEEPRYTIRFTNDEDIQAAGLSSIGTAVFYVPEHSTFVFTQPLKSVKGSDASNFHDEEVGEDEMEFSDDEAEAEHKRQLKARRQGRVLDAGRGRGASKFGRGSHRGGRGGSQGQKTNPDATAYGNGSLEINYDDVPDANDDAYTPLQRPANLTDMMTNREQPQERGLTHPLPPPPPSSHFGRGDFGGRGRGHARGGRGGFRPHRGAGGFSQSRGPSFDKSSGPRSNHQNEFSRYNRPAAPVPNLSLPATPSISPQNLPYPAMTPSPITPLPHVPPNYGGFQPPANFHFAPPSMQGAGPPLNPHFHQQSHQVSQQGQMNQGQPPQHAGGLHTNYLPGPWASNPAIAAALQRQVEEQRRNQGY